MSYNSLEEIVRECQEKDLPFDEVILLDDMNERNVSREESIETMRGMWEAMKGAERNYDGSLQSRSGLVGGAGKTMRAYVESGNTLCGPFVGKVMASALAMGESNACMKRIVAAPTAGACGVLPAVLVNYQKEKGTADEQIVRALYTAAGIGQVVAARAYIAGASGGCQAEIGTASAMAAGALTALGGGTPSQITHAAAMALKNLLGLVCDPVGGLVEVPCVKRNVIGSVNALSAADMALAGIISRIPPDQVIDAMREVGDQMHPSLRETGQGGLANTPQHASGARHRKKNKKNFYFRKTFGIIKESQPRRRFFKMAEAKIQKRNTYTIYDDEGIGTVQIADEVVAIIAGLAATEVDGVASMAGNITNELVSKLGMKNLSKGVKVDVLDGVVCVDLALNLKYGYEIPATCKNVQEKVKTAIENMTGLEVSDVNVAIAGVNMEQTK